MKNLDRVLLVCFAAASSSIAFGANDGTAGASSSGTSTVTVVKTAVMQISGLDDVTLSESGGNYVATEQLCVYSSGVSYNVTVSSAGGSGFQLTSGGNSLDYAVTWEDEGGSPVTLTEGTALTGLTSSADATCSGTGGTNAAFVATVAGTDYAAAAVGTYVDTLTMLIAPD